MSLIFCMPMYSTVYKRTLKNFLNNTIKVVVYHDYEKKKKVLRVCSVTKSCLSLFSTLWTVLCQAALPMEFSRQENWVGCHFLLQGESSWSQDQVCISCGSCIGKEPGKTFSHLGNILVILIIAVLLKNRQNTLRHTSQQDRL